LNDRFLKACRREAVDRTPVWFMRQAGRYMPEYRAIRERHDLLQIVKTPELAVEVTLQPIDAFEVDAAIIFADLLPPLEGMGSSITPCAALPTWRRYACPTRTRASATRSRRYDWRSASWRAACR
jgi:uroporphyrinogen-III decarboxylase